MRWRDGSCGDDGLVSVETNSETCEDQQKQLSPPLGDSAMSGKDPLHTRATFALLLTSILWSSGGVLIKYISLDGAALGGARSALAFIFILTLAGPKHIRLTPAQIGAAVAYAINVVLFVMATKLTTAANAILLQYTAPIYIALLSGFFLKEKVHSKDWAIILVVFSGIALFFLDSLSTAGFLGNIYAIISGIAFAFFFLLMRKQKDETPLGSVILGNLFAALIGLPSMLSSPIPDNNSLLAILALGIIQLGLPYILYSWAIRHVSALEASLLSTLEPILNPVWVALLIGELPGSWALIGGTIVILGIGSRNFIPTLGRRSSHKPSYQ